MTLAEDFRTAAEIIASGGLAKGCFQDDEGGHCAAGALINAVCPGVRRGQYMRNAAPVGPHLVLVLAEVDEVFTPPGRPVGGPMARVAAWNDSDDVDADTVVNLFTRLAEQAEAVGR